MVTLVTQVIKTDLFLQIYKTTPFLQVTNGVANVHQIETLDGNNDMGYFSLSLNSTHDPLESLLSGHILSTTPEPAIDWDEVKRVLTTLTKKIAKDNETHVFIFNTLQNYFEFAKSWRPEWANEKVNNWLFKE